MPVNRQPDVMTSIRTPQNRQLRPVDARPLRLRLLGPFAAEIDGAPVMLTAKRAKALVAYLVRRGGTETARNLLAGLLWGERGEDQARASLRQTLSELRAAFAASPLQPITSTSEGVAWTPESAWVDCQVVEEAAKSGDHERLASAADLLRGEFMEGISTGEPGFEQWLSGEREYFRRNAAIILAKLMDHAERTGDLSGALSHGQRLLSLDPLQEHVHRSLMRIYAAQDRSDAALAQYERLKRELSENLNVSPDSATDALARTIRAARREASPTAPGPAVPALPDKPSIAVLPFQNLSPDPRHEFFADGMTEDIIGALSHLSELFVISRSSSFAYKGRAVRGIDAARELGVRYILDGSVRVAGERVRVSAQLLDTQGGTGNTAWSERFEGDLADIFAVQDHITHAIALALQIKLAHGDSARLWDGRTTNLAAWEKLVVGRSVFQRYSTADNSIARVLLSEALELDPTCAAAMTYIGISHYWDARFSVSLDQQKSLALAEEHLARLTAAHPASPGRHLLRGMIGLVKGEYEDAIASMARAAELAPSDAFSVGLQGLINLYADELQTAERLLQTAMRLNPVRPAWSIYYLMIAQFWLGHLGEARAGSEAYGRLEPEEPYGHAYRAAMLEQSGDQQGAIACIRRINDTSPAFGLANIRSSELYRDLAKREHLQQLLAKAGLT